MHAEDWEDQVIIDSYEAKLAYASSGERIDVDLQFGGGKFNLPHKFYYGAFINEMLKQVNHTSAWFRQEHLKSG